MDLIRAILLEVEAERGPAERLELHLEGWDVALVFEHVRLLAKAGYLRATTPVEPPPRIHVHELTWDGHDFIDAIRSESVWSGVKDRAAEQGVGLPLEVIKSLAIAVVKSKLGIGDV